MASELVHSDGLTPVADNAIVVQSSNASASSFMHSLPTANKEIRGKKMPDNTHGLRFESKLLALFCVRGLGAGYKFELSKEKEDEGGKLEDLIFRYEVPGTTPAGKHWRYRYVQAKHKENEGEKITADHLLGCKRKGESSDSFPKNHLRDYNPKGDFNLTKYFHSFYKIRARGDDIHDCIICTNIGFDENSLKEVGIELVSINNQSEDILKFDTPEKTAHYKLKLYNNDWHKQLKEEWSPVQLLAKELKDCATNNKTTDIRAGMISSYHVALVHEHVIDCTAKKFHQDFVGEVNLSEGARELRQTIRELGVNDSWKEWKFKLSSNFGKGQSAVKNPLPGKITEEDVDNFFDKLVFVVDMPSEEKFEKIIETKDVSKYYPNDKCEDQTTQIFDGISKAFIGQPANFWLTSEVAKNILLKNVSKQYKEQLEKKVGFNDDAIKVMEKKLRHAMDTPLSNKIQRIATPSPQLTAVKVISAVENLLQELKQKEICQGNCLITPSSLSQDEEDKWKNILKLKNYSYDFFVVVCDNEAPVQNYENVFLEGKAEDKNFLIIICCDEPSAGIKDEIQFTDLSDNFQKRILSRIVSFQGKNVEVRALVGDKPEELINFSSTNELLLAENEVKIPSFSTSTFEQSLYVKRTLRFPFENQFKLGGECRISSDGHIEWLVGKEKQKEVWEKIMNGINNQASSTGKPVEDIDLMNLKEKGNEKSIVIISGVAGTGKSTLLSYYCNQIMIKYPDHWVIRINLVDYEASLKLDQNTDLDVVDLIINRLYVVDHKSSFSNSLLRKRLETGDQIVVMFDGFDEINDQCQKGAIEWMKAITKDRLIQLYVTTRPHMLDELQFQLSQLAYRLENFTEEDQIKHLTSYWVKELNLSGDNEKPLQHFGKSLVKQVSETLKDEEKSFIGIPLQCKILAECFQSNVKEFITSNCAEVKEEPRESEISDLLDGKKFDLISLFNRLMETKRKVFREEKAKATLVENKIMTDAINRLIKDVESHLTKLAIKTIVEDQKIVDDLWPPQLSHQSSEDETADEKIIAMNGLSFGLTIESDENTTNATQFLLRTYAEYLFARYLFKGFLLDDKRHNKLLDDKSASKFIVSTILVKREYNGVQVFFNGMLKDLVDDDQEWCNRIVQRDLPDRLKTFAENLYIHILRQVPKVPWFIRKNALLFSLSTGNTMIFTLLCDCLDATLDGKLVQAVMFVFIAILKFTHFFKVKCRCFQRFINYLNFDEGRDMSKSLQFFFASNLEYSQWNGEEQQKTVHHLLQFMTNQREAFENYNSNNNELSIQPMLTFFIFNEKYESHLEIFLGLLSRSIAYSDDYEFANLLKKAFYYQKNFIGGQIEKALAVLYELERNNVLILMQCTVLMLEPTAFQKTYNPLPLVEEDVTDMDLNTVLLEHDSYCMTCLHGAAFHGNTEAIEEMLERIRQNLADPEQGEVADQVITEVLARDKNGFTPFYVAAACGHKEIYHKMLAFLKQVLPVDTLAKHLIDEKGFVHRALSNAIYSANIQMFQLILEALKKELGQKELLQILRLPRFDFPSGIFSFFEESKTKELFNAMAKIVVMRDDNVMDYTDLYDLVFHNHETPRSLLYIDVENLQGLLLLKGVDDFTEKICNNKSGFFNGYSVLSSQLLKHFTKDQLEEFVETITSPNRCEQMESSTILKQDQLLPRNSYWGDFLLSNVNYLRSSGYEEQIFSFFDCFKHLSPSFLQKLLLHEDNKGFIVIQLPLEAVKRMLTYLSSENQEEVKQQWKDNAPSMDTFFPSNMDPFKKKDGLMQCDADYFASILRNYLNYGSEFNLKNFVNIVTSLRNIGEKRQSVWSNVFQCCYKEKWINEILKLVSEKVDILGREAVKTMLLHQIDEMPSLFTAVLWGWDIDALMEILPFEIKEEIQQFMKINAPELIDRVFKDPTTYFHSYRLLNYRSTLNTLTYLLDNSYDNQLQQFVHFLTPATFVFPSLEITQININGSRESSMPPRKRFFSIWAELLSKHCEDHETDDIAKMDLFMKRFSEKLGPNAVKELVLHDNGKGPVIFDRALRGEEKLLETMLKYLSAEDRKEVQHQVDKFLEEKFKIAGDGDWINKYYLHQKYDQIFLY